MTKGLSYGWKKRDGTLIAFASMTDDHLVAAVRMCRRVHGLKLFEVAWREAGAAYSYAIDAPDGASMAAEADADFQLSQLGLDLRLAKRSRRFAGLLAESERRGLDLDLYPAFVLACLMPACGWYTARSATTRLALVPSSAPMQSTVTTA